MSGLKGLCFCLSILLAGALFASGWKSEPGETGPSRGGQTISQENSAAGPDASVFRDGEGRVSPIVRIGEQTWLAKNLRTGRDKNENPLSFLSFEEDKEGDLFGLLYPWESAGATAPAGWHLPTVKDWQRLIQYLGGDAKAGFRLLKTGPAEFGALPVGGIDVLGKSLFRGERAVYWTSAEADVHHAFAQVIERAGRVSLERLPKSSRFSVRLIRDDAPDFDPTAAIPGGN